MGCADCGKSCAKALLMIFNVIFFIIGVVLFAVGIWIRVDKSIWDYVSFIDFKENDRYLEYGAYLIIGLGAFIFLTSIIGFCGALRESRTCLSIYMFVLIIAIAAEIAAAVLFIIYRDDIEDTVRNELKDVFDEEVINESSSYWTVLRKFQEEFECCGITEGADEYSNLNTTGPDRRHLRDCTDLTAGKSFPCSCCGASSSADAVGNCTVYAQSCEQELKDFIEAYSIIGIGVAIGFACIEILGFIFALCLCMNAGSSGKYE